MQHLQTFFQQLTEWATKQENILGAALVGSHARNAAKESSDIDLIIITKNPNVYINDNSWIYQFGTVKPDGIHDEDWGVVKTKRVFYENGIEVEFNLATEEWAQTNPVDEGTKQVMSEGNKILVDKDGLFVRLTTTFL